MDSWYESPGFFIHTESPWYRLKHNIRGLGGTYSSNFYGSRWSKVSSIKKVVHHKDICMLHIGILQVFTSEDLGTTIQRGKTEVGTTCSLLFQ